MEYNGVPDITYDLYFLDQSLLQSAGRVEKELKYVHWKTGILQYNIYHYNEEICISYYKSTKSIHHLIKICILYEIDCPFLDATIALVNGNIVVGRAIPFLTLSKEEMIQLATCFWGQYLSVIHFTLLRVEWSSIVKRKLDNTGIIHIIRGKNYVLFCTFHKLSNIYNSPNYT